MKDLVLFIVKRLAGNPDQVELTEIEAEGVTRLELKVAEEDKGKIIGKEGKVIKAIRALVAVAAGKDGRRAVVEVL